MMVISRIKGKAFKRLMLFRYANPMLTEASINARMPLFTRIACRVSISVINCD